ncbi:MAG: MFS transporter, partial [Caldimonas sp.]
MAEASVRPSRALLALIGGQVSLHASMAGVRLAAPLAALRDGYPAWAVGVLLGLFAAAPIVLALAAGRLADRHGYHVPMRLAVALAVCGGVCAVVATTIPSGQFVVLCIAALFCGAGANFGLIAIQRSAGRMAHDTTELKRIFSWLGLAPALANVIGPVLAGTIIDAAGFQLAFAALAALPLASLVWTRFVPVEPRADVAASSRR